MIRNTRVYGLEESIIASGYPMTVHLPTEDVFNAMVAGNNAMDKRKFRARQLGKVESGTGHDNYLKGIIVQADMIMSHGWWMQAMRYHWFDIVSSQSKEHRCKELFGCDNPDDVKIGDKLGARITTNYLQLKTMYGQRKAHRRHEWKEFCEWCNGLTMFKELTIK